MTRLLCPTPKSFSTRVARDAKRRLEAHFKTMSQSEFDRVARNYHAVLVRFETRIGEEIMSGNSRLRAILSPTTGLDHIDLAAAKRHGIKVFHLKDQKKLLANVSATAELTVGLMIALARKLPQAFESVKANRWQNAKFRGCELAGKTLGIVGYGRLGKKVAKVAHALAMQVVAYDIKRVRMPGFVKRCSDLDTLLRQSDVVSIHVPLSDDTRGLLGRRELAQMKEGALLINTARAVIVDQTGLLAALRAGNISGAAVDVLDREYAIGTKRQPLIDYAREHDNLLITPHIGGATEESIEKTDMNVLQRYLDWVFG